MSDSAGRERMKRAYQKYNDRVCAVAGREMRSGGISVEYDALRAIVAGTDVPYEDLCELADTQVAQGMLLMLQMDPAEVLSGIFRSAFLAGVFFGQDEDDV